MFNQSMLFENSEDKFNQSFGSYGEESLINQIIESDMDVNEDEILSLYFNKRSDQKTEETNKNQNITETEELERIDEKIDFKDNSEIDINITKGNESQNIISTPKEITNFKTNEKNNKIFNIVKIKKKSNKKGRLYKNEIKKHFYRYHDKFKEDNIIKKIKTSFIKKTMNYINKEYGIYLNKHKIRKIEKLIRRITPANSVRNFF